jgi:hypothetical protein
VRAYLAYAIIFLIAATFFIQPATAFTSMTAPYVDSGDFLYVAPIQYTDLIIAEYNNVNMVTTSNETINIDFPVFADGAHIGPNVAETGMGLGIGGGTGIGIGTGAKATANVLPFGPVDLAFPSISQTANDTYAYQRTYFFSDTSI